jgi:hypothetical protein
MRSTEFTEDTLGTNPKRAPRTGTRHSRGHEPVPRYRSTDEDKQKGVDGKVCWDGYKRMGTKQKDGKTVDNCVPMNESTDSSTFQIGDPVIITGDVEYQGKTGDVREIGRDGAFVVVDLYNYGPYSFHASDVGYNNYADSEDDQEGSLNEFAPGDGDDEENPLDDYPCYDCGSTIFLHHTRLCDLAEPDAVRDLPAEPGTQYWTGRVPNGLAPIPGLSKGVAEAEKIGNMDADRFDDAMARLKRLAGAGPLKTVYDPAKRVYRNVPTAVQPPTQPKK